MTAAEGTLPALGIRGFDKELWVGLFVLLGTVAVLTLLFAATEPATFQGRYTVTGSLPDAAGLRPGDSVVMRGVKIGRVRSFDLNGTGVLVRLEVDGKYRIPADSQLRLSPVSLLGDVVAEVVPGRSSEQLPKGAVIRGVVRPGAITEIQGLAGQAEELLGRVQEVLDDETVQNVQESTAELNVLLQELSGLVGEQRQQLGRLSNSLAQSAKGLERATAGPELERTVERMDQLTAKLSTVADSLDRSSRSAESVMARLDKGEGSLGRLTKDDALYLNANQAVQNLSRAADELIKLTQDFRQNPKRYIDLSIF